MKTIIDETSLTLFAEILPIELTNGNDGRGSKWFSSANARKKIEAKLRQLGHVREPFSQPVEVRVTRIVGPNQRLWDSSSIGRGNWKEIEDAMVACGWFHDDSPKHIVETRFFQDDENRDKGPATFVQIVERSAQ
jgi:hypothetical protein